MGRSQMAEAIFRHHYSSLQCMSAGIDSEKYLGKPLPEKIVSVMTEKKVDMRGHYSKQLTSELIEIASKVFVLCKKEECPNYFSRHQHIEYWDIPDPKNSDNSELRMIRDSIDEKVRTMYN